MEDPGSNPGRGKKTATEQKYSISKVATPGSELSLGLQSDTLPLCHAFLMISCYQTEYISFLLLCVSGLSLAQELLV